MSFLAPGYVVLTALFAVPIAIHLIGRSRAKVRRFAAHRAACCAATSAWRGAPRSASCCCCSLRALAIAAVPLILAKPFVEAASDDLPASRRRRAERR